MADQTKRILKLHTALERVMADERFDDGRRRGHELRALIIAHHWAMFEGDRGTRWKRTMQLAGLGHEHVRRDTFNADAPRYEPGSYCAPHGRPCPSLMVRGPRAGEPCGHPGTRQCRVTDPATGEWEVISWCYRHSVDADEAWAAERRRVKAGTLPKPLPNTGGLLPCHIRASNWPDIYRWAMPGWEPPEIGINADDWPMLAKVAAHAAPKLQVIDGDGETAAPGLPMLRLVTS